MRVYVARTVPSDTGVSLAGARPSTGSGRGKGSLTQIVSPRPVPDRAEGDRAEGYGPSGTICR